MQPIEYPRPVMRRNELKEMGFDESFLDYVIRNQGNKGIAWKSDPTKKNSPFNYNTAAFERFRQGQCVEGW